MNYQTILASQFGLNIIFKPNMERARNPINRGQDWKRYKPVSFKSSVRKTIHCESFPEAQFQKCLECNSQILDYCEQPALIKYTLGADRYKHIPDFLIEDNTVQPKFVEIKAGFNDIDEEVLIRTKFLKNLLPKIGFGYEIIVISEINKSIIENSNWIYRKAQSLLIDANPDWISNIKPQSLLKEFEYRELPFIAKLIIQGKLHIDLSIPINANSIISTSKIGDIKWTN